MRLGDSDAVSSIGIMQEAKDDESEESVNKEG